MRTPYIFCFIFYIPSRPSKTEFKFRPFLLNTKTFSFTGKIPKSRLIPSKSFLNIIRTISVTSLNIYIPSETVLIIGFGMAPFRKLTVI